MKFGARTDPFGSRRTMIVFTLAAGVAAVGIGLVGGAFRWCLERAGELRGELLVWAHTLGPAGVIVPVSFVAACALIGRIFARITPRASGSGIQDVEAVWHEEEELPGPAVLPARFLGGVIAIGSGMVMGREGPTVHLGATIGADIGRWFRLSDYERKLLYTTVGGAGLAVAFNAPIGGALFTIEEVTRSFRVRVVLITLVTTSVAVGVSRYLVPGGAIFTVPPIATPGFVGLWPYLLSDCSPPRSASPTTPSQWACCATPTGCTSAPRSGPPSSARSSAPSCGSTRSWSAAARVSPSSRSRAIRSRY